MSNPSRLTDEERANLVAYLDGELSPEASQALEAKLARDPAARTEVERLRKTWELLDFLPKAVPSSDFTQRTLMKLGPIVTGQQPGPKIHKLPRWVFPVGWAASVAAAMIGGYLALSFVLGHARHEPTDKDLVHDLSVIEHKHMYDLVQDIDFLRKLDDPDLPEFAEYGTK